MIAGEGLRMVYLDLLDGAIFENGQIVPVFDGYAPDNVVEPYIILADISVSQRPESYCEMYRATTMVDVVTKFDFPEGAGKANRIAEQVDSIIRPPGVVQIEGVASTVLINSRMFNLKDGQKYVYRRILTYNHEI